MGLRGRSPDVQATERSSDEHFTGFSRLILTIRVRASGLATYTGFRWLMRIMLGLVVLQICLQWIITPILLIVLPSQEFLPPHSYYLLDFSFYYVAAYALRENPHVNLYSPLVLPAVAHTHHLFYDVAEGRFDYPLLLPILLIPLAFFTFQTAARIWFVINVLLWMLNTALIIAWLRRGLLGVTVTSRDGVRRRIATTELDSKSRNWRDLGGHLRDRWHTLSSASQFALVFGLLVCLGYAPMIEAQALGQATMIMLTCFLLAPWFIERGHPEIAGFLLTVAALIKIFPVILIAYYLFQRRWRVVFGALASFFLLLGAMAIVVGIPGILSMIGIFSAVSTTQLSTVLNESLAHAPVWIAIELGSSSNIVTAIIGDLLVAVIALAFMLGILVKNWRDHHAANKRDLSNTQTEDDYLGYSWALCTMLLVIPISQEHYDIWLLPAILFCLGFIIRRLGLNLRDVAGRMRPEVMLALGVIVALVITFDNLPFHYDGTLSLNLGPYIMGHPLRPLFMLLRPIGALLVWFVAGILFLRPSLRTRLSQSGKLVTSARVGERVGSRHGVSAGGREEHEQSGYGTDRIAPLPGPGDVPWQSLAGTLLSFLGALIVMRVVVQVVVNVAIATPK